jgi:hypothetical protein
LLNPDREIAGDAVHVVASLDDLGRHERNGRVIGDGEEVTAPDLLVAVR